MNITCTIDSREKERIPYAKNFFNNYYPLAVELETGDYMFENTDTDECVIFEYKTINDFIGSVSDGRIFEQVKRMNEEFDWSFIVIEGTIDDLIKENRRRMIYKNTGKPFHLKQYYSAIARLNCYTTVMQCHNQAHSFQYMEKQVLKIFDDKPLIKHFKKDSDNPAVNYLASINGINYKTAKLIVDEYDIRNLHDLVSIANTVNFTDIDGIGQKKARLIEEAIR
jgi:DNA excision repair protein ERCC-4